MFVFIVVSYDAGHGKECVTEMVRVESTDSPLSAMAVVKAPPRGTGVCEITFSHIKSSDHDSVPFLQSQLKVGMERLTRRITEKFLSRKVCTFFAVAVVLY